MGRLRWFLAIICLGFLTACGGQGGGGGGNTDPGPPAIASISGTVTYKGLPMSGATIYAWSTNSNAIVKTTTTDANGNYTITSLGDTAVNYLIIVR